jgi:hypothetical protein
VIRVSFTVPDRKTADVEVKSSIENWRALIGALPPATRTQVYWPRCLSKKRAMSVKASLGRVGK